MRSKNSKPIADDESDHMAAVKSLQCSVCNAAGPCEAHHIVQGLHFLTVALCDDCHTGSITGIHGRKANWLVRHMTELDALNVTLKRLAA